MSASLVGSEMCIRDSAWSARPSARRRCPGGSATYGTWSIGAASAPSQGPVSYTHLTLPTICSV
eukprot:13108799-Alexandrium_andersonii.AAC.1